MTREDARRAIQVFDTDVEKPLKFNIEPFGYVEVSGQTIKVSVTLEPTLSCSMEMDEIDADGDDIIFKSTNGNCIRVRTIR